MTLEQIRTNFGFLLNEANLKGAFNLEQANAAVQTLTALDQLIKAQAPVLHAERPLADPHE